MFIIDEIEWLNGSRPPKYNLIGGAGTYAVLGARLASSPCQRHAKNISWIVDEGSDFPTDIKRSIESWNTDCLLRLDQNRLTTRAWNGYGDNEFRSFKYLTPKKRLEVMDLTERQVLSKSFHMVCSPERCLDLYNRLDERRSEIYGTLGRKSETPVIVWEPIPDLCSPAELAKLQEATRDCAVVSPNAEELRMFFGPEIIENEDDTALVERLMGWSTSNKRETSTICIVREGADGSTGYRYDGPSNGILVVHVPAYHTKDMQNLVVDPTGGGNTYLGALAIALTGILHDQPTYDVIVAHCNRTRPSTLTIAMIYATIAASFVLEQHGVPILKQNKSRAEIFEHWNGEPFIDRLKKYLERESANIEERTANMPKDAH